MSRMTSKVGGFPLFVLVASAVLLFMAGCGGDSEPEPLDPIELPTPVPLTENEIRATLVKTLTPPTPTPDAHATKTAELRATRGAWPEIDAPRSGESGYYLNPNDVEYLTRFGPVVWHASRVDLLVSGLFIGHTADNTDLADFFGRYEFVDRPEQWKCNEPLWRAVHREMLNLRAEHETLSEYSVVGVSPAASRYAADLRRAVQAVDVTGNAFLRIQDQVCAADYLPENPGDTALTERRKLHGQIALNTAIFHRLMSDYGCAVCGELYRR